MWLEAVKVATVHSLLNWLQDTRKIRSADQDTVNKIQTKSSTEIPIQLT